MLDSIICYFKDFSHLFFILLQVLHTWTSENKF